MIPDLTMNYGGGATDTFNFYGHIDNFPTGQQIPWTGTLTLRLIPAPPAALPLLALAAIAHRARRRRA